KGLSPFVADRKHIHHKLIDRGFSHAQTAIILYVVCVVVPIISMFFGGVNPTITFFGMFAISFLVVNAVFLLPRKKPKKIFSGAK
ncbi:MAG: undecaprenyl/decaprenyl-phosphate alpha-N-acetylglucosaminyl 1-phosphate transferase, partial [Cryomorphaceae bacterium]